MMTRDEKAAAVDALSDVLAKHGSDPALGAMLEDLRALLSLCRARLDDPKPENEELFVAATEAVATVGRALG